MTMLLAAVLLTLRKCWMMCCSTKTDEDDQLLTDEGDAAGAPDGTEVEEDPFDPSRLQCCSSGLGLSYEKAPVRTMWEPHPVERKQHARTKAITKAKACAKKKGVTNAVSNGQHHVGTDALMLEWEAQVVRTGGVKQEKTPLALAQSTDGDAEIETDDEDDHVL